METHISEKPWDGHTHVHLHTHISTHMHTLTLIERETQKHPPLTLFCRLSHLQSLQTPHQPLPSPNSQLRALLLMRPRKSDWRETDCTTRGYLAARPSPGAAVKAAAPSRPRLRQCAPATGLPLSWLSSYLLAVPSGLLCLSSSFSNLVGS